jgi:AcrR family transcriptional regulator
MVQQRRKTEFRKQQIIDAARRLIIKKGSEHLTVRSIAKEVGLTEAAIYRHFKSKREILSFLMDHILSSMLKETERSHEEDTVSLETLNRILKSHLSEIEQRRGMSFQVIAEIISLGDKKLNKEVYTGLMAYIGRLKHLFEEASRAGTVRDDVDLDSSAMLLFGMIQGLVSIWALGAYQFDLLDHFDRLWAIYRRAIDK